MNSDLAERLREFYLRAHRLMDRAMTANGASYARTKFLLLLAREGPIRSTDIAAAFSLAPRTVTEALDALERDGLVRRDPDPVDRRAKRVSITDAGQAAVRTSEPARIALLDEMFGALDDADRAAFAIAMDKLNARLAAIENR
jgi:DNA-binding MarR family transcriptional regulator